MDIATRKALLAAMKILCDAADKAEGGGLRIIARAYNHLHLQLDGHVTRMPEISKPEYKFVYNKTHQAMVLDQTI